MSEDKNYKKTHREEEKMPIKVRIVGSRRQRVKVEIIKPDWQRYIELKTA